MTEFERRVFTKPPLGVITRVMLTRRDWIGMTSLAAGTVAVNLSPVQAAIPDASLPPPLVEADRILADQVGRGEVTAAAFLARRGTVSLVRAYGKARTDTPFLIASPTKPMTVSAVLWLRDHGLLQLSDPVQKHLPEFKGGERDQVTIKHLLTHTSGLPDMLPENVELRKQHAPLSEFVARTCRTPLLFHPGEKVSYQSMGILLAATIVEKLSSQPVATLLERSIFGALGMKRTSLGLGGRRIADTAQCQVDEPSDWDWNSEYWRNLGAPWGGAHSTVEDLATFLEAFVSDKPAPWRPETRREMREIQTGALRPSYGLGWVREPGAFGRTCSRSTFGHFGSTGTVFWHDPETATTCVILTTKPAESSRKTVLVPVSEKVGAASWA